MYHTPTPIRAFHRPHPQKKENYQTPKITAIQTIRTRAAGRWVIVKVLTDQPGLYGFSTTHDHHSPTLYHSINPM